MRWRASLRERWPWGKSSCETTSTPPWGFPKLAKDTRLHVKSLHQMFGPKGNPTASSLFEIVAYLQRHEGVCLQVIPAGP
jgi:hypothetical protein